VDMVNPSLQKEHIHLECLDALVISCLEEWQRSSKITDVRQPILEGDIEQALVLLEAVCPQVLKVRNCLVCASMSTVLAQECAPSFAH